MKTLFFKLASFMSILSIISYQPLQADESLEIANQSIDYIFLVQDLCSKLGSNFVQLAEGFTGGKNAQVSTAGYVGAINLNSQVLAKEIALSLFKNNPNPFLKTFNFFLVSLNQYTVNATSLILLEKLSKSTVALSEGFFLLLNKPNSFSASQREAIVLQFQTYLNEFLQYYVTYNGYLLKIANQPVNSREVILNSLSPQLVTLEQQIISSWAHIGNYAAQVYQGISV